MTQTAVCSHHHAVEQQVCRWLLFVLDRLGSSEIRMTQERSANLLGVRREGVTEAAGSECYAVVSREYEPLLPARSRAKAGSPRADRS